MGDDIFGVKTLPIFKGYTVDERLREFRKFEFGKPIEIYPFNSEKGMKLLKEYRGKE